MTWRVELGGVSRGIGLAPREAVSPRWRRGPRVRSGAGALGSAPICRAASMTIPQPARVVERAGTEVPGVQVRAEQHDLLGRLAARDLPDHVGRLRVGQRAAGQREAHAHRPAPRQPRQQAGVGRRERGGGDRRDVLLVVRPTGVRQAAVVGADRAHQEPDRAELRERRGRSVGTHASGRAVARAVGRARRLPVDEGDLAADRVPLRGELLERLDPDDLALEAPLRCGDRCRRGPSARDSGTMARSPRPSRFPAARPSRRLFRPARSNSPAPSGSRARPQHPRGLRGIPAAAGPPDP